MVHSLKSARPDSLVSVAIPVYNGTNYLTEAVESLLAQTYEDLEIIICDDCSTDATVELAHSFNDPRIAVRAHDQRLGQAGNLGRAIQYASGYYFKFLFHDDLLEPEHIQEAVAGFDQGGPDVALVASRRRIIRADGTSLPITRGVSKTTGFLSGDEVIRRCIRSASNLIGEPSFVLTRRAEMLRHLPLRLSYVVDLDVWSRMLRGRRFGAIGSVLGSFRLSPNSVTSQAASTQAREVREFINLLQSERPDLLGRIDRLMGHSRAELNQRLRNFVARLA